MEKTQKIIESIEKKINAYLERQQAAEFIEDYGIQWIEYYYTDDDDYSASVRMTVEDYVKDLICDVELPPEDERDEDDYDGCTEDWEIKLCVHYGVHSRDDLDWGTIIADVESESVGSYIVYQLAEQIAEQRADDEATIAPKASVNNDTYKSIFAKRHFPSGDGDSDAWQDLYSGIAPLYGGWILTTAGDPLTLEACEKAGDEATIAKVNALLSSDDWRVTMGTDDIYYVADCLKAWGIDF